eukprot:2453424-Amphidinium_carterae.1
MHLKPVVRVSLLLITSKQEPFPVPNEYHGSYIGRHHFYLPGSLANALSFQKQLDTPQSEKYIFGCGQAVVLYS